MCTSVTAGKCLVLTKTPSGGSAWCWEYLERTFQSDKAEDSSEKVLKSVESM